MLRLLGNIVWMLLGGIEAALLYWVTGLLLCLTIVGIPFGIQAFKLGMAVLMPFGRELQQSKRANSPFRLLFNIVWLLLAGWSIACVHLAGAIAFGITIIGIPFAYQHLKLIPLALFPFGRDLD